MKQVIRHGRQEPLLPGRNEAAERLRDILANAEIRTPVERDFDAALAAERRATVERIRAALDKHRKIALGSDEPPVLYLMDILAILDAEAQP